MPDNDVFSCIVLSSFIRALFNMETLRKHPGGEF